MADSSSTASPASPKPPFEISMDGFEAFCRSKPPYREYDYINPHDCPIAQYIKSLCASEGRFGRVSVNSESWSFDGDYSELPPGMNLVSCGAMKLPREERWTFGRLVQRIDEWRAEH